MFSTCSKECSTKHGNFSLVSAPPLSLSPLSPLRPPIDDRVTASRLRRLRVLLTGRHGNLATSLQWPKVDGLRAGAPEQTEQKSVHARTRNRTCNVRRSLSSLSLPLSLSPRRLRSTLFFSLLSRRVAFRIAPRITLPRSSVYVPMVFVSCTRAIQTPGGDRLPMPRSAADSDIME